MAKNTGKAYEELTEKIFNRLLDEQTGLVADVKRDVTIEGRSTKHQIDVTFTFKIGTTNYRTIIQCKDWASPVKQEQVLAFNSVLTDIPGQPRGIIVSRTGFQSGARSVAEHHGIELYELRETTDDDWEGLVRTIEIQLFLQHPKFNNFKPILEVEGIKILLKEKGLDKYNFRVVVDSNSGFMDRKTLEIININKILNDLIKDKEPVSASLEHIFENTVLLSTGDEIMPQIPICGFKVDVEFTIIEETINVPLDHMIAYTFKSILSEDMRLVREDLSFAALYRLDEQ